MKTKIAISCLMLLASLCPGQQAEPTKSTATHHPLKDRWFFAFGYERNRQDVDKIKSLIDTAAEHGLNGMVLSSFGLDSITRWNEEDIALLKEVADTCAAKHIELIPTGFSAGYGGGALGHNRNFAAALPTTLSLRAKQGALVPNSAENLVVNGDLEAFSNNRFKGYAFHDDPGVVSFADTVSASGKASIRFEHFGEFEHGHGRINQKVVVTPGRTYRLSYKIKTENLQPVTGLKAMVYADGRSLADIQPDVKSTQDWTEVTLEYVNKEKTDVLLYIGIWQGKSGKFWIDDIKFCESGDLSNIVRRKGTPLVLKSKDRDLVFTEGKDFKAIRCLNQVQSIPLLPNSAIQENERLELSCYKIPYISHAWGKQISLCMSNPELYEYWEREAKRLYEIIPFKRYLLSMDEIRNGGGCLSCQNSGKTMAEILGDCFTRQRAILKALDPDIEVITWSDMLDPAHNAHNNYYGVVGDFSNSWKYAPKDLSIMCWHHGILNQSLEFFSKHGFRTYGAAYYDAADLSGSQDWLSALRKTPNAQGILYTTWEKKYQLLGAFGDLVIQ